MKYINSLLILLLVVWFWSCGQKSSHDHESTSEHQASSGKDWKEMDDYHMIMAEAFHPYMDSANLQPAKEKAPELVVAANKWKEATLPEKVNNDQTRAKLKKLAELSQTLDDQVKGGNDQATGATLNQLHDLFHELQNDWYGAAAEEDEHHDH